MSPEERQLISGVFERIETASTTPRDPQAQELIDDSVRRNPKAPYFLAQAVIIQEKALQAAGDTILQLQAQIGDLQRQQRAAPQAEASGGFLGGLGSLFGGDNASRQPARTSVPPTARQQQGQLYNDYAANAPMQPQQSSGPWGQQPSGPWSQQAQAPSAGGSFLRGALGTAAGVAGGMMLAESLSGIFGSHPATSGLAQAAGLENMGSTTPAATETTVNNYYGNDDGGSGDSGSDQNDGYQQADDDYSNDNSDDGSFDV